MLNHGMYILLFIKKLFLKITNFYFRKELCTQYTNIVFLPCFAHQANLCVGDIFKSSERYREVSNQAIKITSFFNMSTYFLGQLCSQQMNLYNGKAYALTSPCATRWNSFYNSFHSILKSKGALMVILNFFILK